MTAEKCEKVAGIRETVRYTIKAEDLFRNLPDLIPLGQAAKELGVGRTKKYELLDILPSIKVGKEHHIPKRILAEYVVATIKTKEKRHDIE